MSGKVSTQAGQLLHLLITQLETDPVIKQAILSAVREGRWLDIEIKLSVTASRKVRPPIVTVTSRGDAP
jgi:hypothetical protein